MPRTLPLLCFFAALVLGACSATAPATPMAAEPMNQPDGLGPQAATSGPPARIVSLTPSTTEIVFAVGAGSQLVGRDSFSDYPAAAADVPDVGGGFASLNTELIVASRPDLILVSPITPPEQVADLEKLGLIVHVVPNPASFDELFANLRSVADLTGHDAEGAALVTALQGRVDAIASQIGVVSERPLVYYELDATDPSAPYTSGPGTFVDLLIRSAGGENFGAQLTGEWVQVSVEELLIRQPDVIVLGDFTYGGVTPDKIRARAGWDALAAVQGNRVFTFDDNLVSRPGPRLVDGLEAMAKLLHPELVR